MKGIAFAFTLAITSGAIAQIKVTSATRVVIPIKATETQTRAATELATTLSQITGQKIYVTQRDARPENAIFVGVIPITDRGPLLGNEDFAFKTEGSRLYIYGGNRGVLYGVYRLLQEQCGVRWWTPWATTIPSRPKLVIPKLDKREKPYFEARDPFWFHAFDGEWAAHNYSNSQSARLTPELGGKLTYQGFVHTFYELVPPSLFKDHPEWFSLIDGKRTADGAQLCTTDPALRDFVVRQVRALLKANPTANIVSVSQNDWYRPCQCERCQALVKAEGSESAPVLALANYVAEKIEKDYPNVAIDTLAYQYTRKAPRTLKPRENVIVRLCSIECNFAQPLIDPSNQAFMADLKDWSRLTDRLYIWDYVTNFPHYVQPFPNYFVLGPNLRAFAQNGVKGVFEEGAYQSCGAEMAEMRAWVLAQLMWNPNLDDKKLIDEFLQGYYGKAAAKPIRQYLDLMAKAAAHENMTIWSDTRSPYLGFPTMVEAEKLWQKAEAAAQKDPELLWRVKVAHLPVRTVWLSRWEEFRYQALKTETKWPLPDSRRKVADAWMAVALEPWAPGWSPLTHMSEGGQTPQQFLAPLQVDPPEPQFYELARKTGAGLPADLNVPKDAQVIVGEDNLARLWNEPQGAQLRPDPTALDGVACWMPGRHHEWAFQVPFSSLPAAARSGEWRVFVVARVEMEGEASVAFSAGVYDGRGSREALSRRVGSAEVSKEYKTFELGTVDANSSEYVWVAPPQDRHVKAVWVDRIILVRA